MKFKVLLNKILFDFNLRNVLPAQIINVKKIVENGEDLISLKANLQRVFFSEKLQED